MRKLLCLVTSWAAVFGLTRHPEASHARIPDNPQPAPALVEAAPAPAEQPAPALPEWVEPTPRDTFSAALAVINGEAGPASDSAADVSLPPLVECFHPLVDSIVSTAPLADGRVSSFRIGEEGSDTVRVSENGGLCVGATAVDSHVIEITAHGKIVPGTYTLIDYDGAIGGGGFGGLVLQADAGIHAELVNNTADTKIELVVSEVSDGNESAGEMHEASLDAAESGVVVR